MQVYLKTKEGTKHRCWLILESHISHFPYFATIIQIEYNFEEIPVQDKYEVIVENIEDNPNNFPIDMKMIEDLNKDMNNGDGMFVAEERTGGWRNKTKNTVTQRIISMGNRVVLSEKDYEIFDKKYQEYLKTQTI